jgi:hypothetical protein
VEQLPFHGAWHGYVNATTGGLVFRVVDMRLPGRMPLEIGRVYDSKISSSLPPPPPGMEAEPRWGADLGKNWILSYSGYLIPYLWGRLHHGHPGRQDRALGAPGRRGLRAVQPPAVEAPRVHNARTL